MGEVSVTQGTGVGLLPGVGTGVSRQTGSVGKGGAALCTGEGPFPRVGSAVSVQGSCPGEYLPTVWALVVAPRVDPHVCHEARRRGEGLFALRAGVRFLFRGAGSLCCVDLEVLGQTGQLVKGLPTAVTAIGVVPGVRAHVPEQGVRGLERLVALETFVGPILRVRVHVAGQLRGLHEGFAAALTFVQLFRGVSSSHVPRQTVGRTEGLLAGGATKLSSHGHQLTATMRVSVN